MECMVPRLNKLQKLCCILSSRDKRIASRDMTCICVDMSHPSYLPQTMAMMGITFNIHALCFFAAHGLSGAASTRVGNDLGAGRPHMAWLTVQVRARQAVDNHSYTHPPRTHRRYVVFETMLSGLQVACARCCPEVTSAHMSPKKRRFYTT